MFIAKIYVTLKQSVLDPQGTTVENALGVMGYTNVNNVRIGKYIEMNIEAVNRQEAEKLVQDAADKLLANPVIENYRFSIEEA